MDSTLSTWLVLWAGACLLLLVSRARSRRQGSGLLYAYVVGFWTIHGLAALLYALPGNDFRDIRTVQYGFALSTLAIWCFVLGSEFVTPFLERLFSVSPPKRPAVEPPSLAGLYWGVGLAFYGLTRLPAVRIPTISALVATGQSLLVVGMCLALWRAWSTGRRGLMGVLLVLSLGLPFFTIMTSGFMGYGAVASLLLLAFAASLSRPRWTTVVGAALVAYVGLSFYVSYMRDRADIREVVWGGRSLEARAEQLWDTLSTFEFFDPSDPVHVWAVNIRLNQNLFVGIAAERLRFDVGEDYAWGGTLVDAMLALAPRILWPDKPIFAGSGDVVSRYTGLRFAEGTSVGIGQVLEFYINFGVAGVAAGFLILGTLVAMIDSAARRRLAGGDQPGFVLWFVIGMAFLQSGGSLIELVGSAGAGAALVLVIGRGYHEWCSWRGIGAGGAGRPTTIDHAA